MLNVSAICALQCKTHKLPFIVGSQLRPQCFPWELLQAATLFFIRNQVDYQQKYRLFVVQLYHVCFGSIGRLPSSPTPTHSYKEITWSYRGADKPLTRPGRKPANVSVRGVGISFGALPCRGGGETYHSSRLDVVEIARVPDMLPSLFPSWSG